MRELKLRATSVADFESWMEVLHPLAGAVKEEEDGMANAAEAEEQDDVAADDEVDPDDQTYARGRGKSVGRTATISAGSGGSIESSSRGGDGFSIGGGDSSSGGDGGGGTAAAASRAASSAGTVSDCGTSADVARHRTRVSARRASGGKKEVSTMSSPTLYAATCFRAASSAASSASSAARSESPDPIR